jgi:hypothetical protein
MLNQDFKEFIQLLNDNQVNYMNKCHVCGSTEFSQELISEFFLHLWQTCIRREYPLKSL